METLRGKLTELCREHEMLRGRMRDHAALMDSMKAPDDAYMDALIPSRIRFRAILETHSAEEDLVIADALARNQPEDGTALAAIFPFGMRGVLGQYDRLMDGWSADRIRSDWIRYRESVLIVQRQFAERLAWEEREVYLRFI